MHDGGRNSRISGHKAQHSGHIRADHARPFADAGDADGFATHLRLQAMRFGHGIGGHDGSRRIAPIRRRGILLGRRQGGNDALVRQRLHDHPRAKWQNLLGLQLQLRGHSLAHSLGAGIAISASTCVGIAGVDDEGAHRSARGQLFLTNLHRRSAKTVAGEYAAHARAFVQQKQGHIFAVFLAHTRLHGADAHARNGVQRSWICGAEIHRHGRLSSLENKGINLGATQADLAA